MPVHDVTNTTAALVGDWVAAVIYGLNVPLYIFCLHILGKDRTTSKRILSGVTSVHIAIASAHICLSLAVLIQGFLRTPPGLTEMYFASQSTPLHLAQLWMYFGLIAVGDYILAWRCYVVWKHNPAIGVYFLVSCITYFVAEVINLVKIGHTVTEAEFFAAYTWTTIGFSISLAIQIVATCLVVLRIWITLMRRTDTPTRSSNLAIISMMIESGVVLTGASLVVLALFRSKLAAGGLIAPIHAQLSFFIPASIVARTGLRQLVRNDPDHPRIRFPRPGFRGFRQDESLSTDIPLSSTLGKTSKASTTITAEAYGDNVYMHDASSSPLGEYGSIAVQKAAQAMS